MVSNREQYLPEAERIRNGGPVTVTDAHLMATALLEVAELAMPATYFATDSRCEYARAVLEACYDCNSSFEVCPECKFCVPCSSGRHDEGCARSGGAR